jgi:ribosome-associated protein|tara:strand:+ start:1035 stop:1247 length:213 start_codon:yes stop_codon:yes gene_type:complete
LKEHEFVLTEEYIQLIQLLKVLSLVGSGGEAKEVVREELVFCNGELETRMRYKVRKGDEIEFEGNLIKVV